MPEEIEVPTEHLHEHMEHAAHGGHEGGGNFNLRVALSSAVIAVFAAISALMAGHHANEALLNQLEASDTWAQFQSKSIKQTVLASKMDLLGALGKKAGEKDAEKLKGYDEDKEKLQEKATELEKEREAHMAHHVILARAVTFFQIAIALSAMAVLTKKKPLWLASLGLGVVGIYFMIMGLA